MKCDYARKVFSSMILIVLGCFPLSLAQDQQPQGGISAPGSAKSQIAEPSSPTASDLIQPEELARSLGSPSKVKPLIIQVGFRVLYTQAHIPGSQYVGPANSPAGIQQLRKQVESLPRTQTIIIYCGCCPWNVCPNVNPAFRELRLMGFKSVKALYIAHDFGKEWVEKGFPVEKGK